MEKMGSKKNTQRKPMRRRSHTRKIPQDRIINLAEARREIVNALHLHRASLSSSSCLSDNKRVHTILGEWLNHGLRKCRVASTSAQHCTFLMEPMPMSQSTWSTTSPSVHPSPLPIEVHEFEWEDNLASSYIWWLGFLKTLDVRNHAEKSKEKYPFDEEIEMNSFGLFRKFKDGPDSVEPPSLEEHDSSLDEWLTVPTENESEMEMNKTRENEEF